MRSFVSSVLIGALVTAIVLRLVKLNLVNHSQIIIGSVVGIAFCVILVFVLTSK